MNYWEQQYNPRLAVPDAQRHFDRWRELAVEARATLRGSLDVAYGPHERERLDVFRAATPRGALVFIHGGYWRAFSKEDFSWIAAPFVRAGITVVIPSYPLAPQTELPAICDSIAKAMRHIAENVLTTRERERIVVAGHSAGAHLAADYLAHPDADAQSTLVPSAVVCISGIFDLAPLEHVPLLANMGWTSATLHEVSPLYRPPPARGTLVLAVGALESREFHRQSERLAAAWPERCTGVHSIPDCDHFSVLDTLCEPGGVLWRRTLEVFA